VTARKIGLTVLFFALVVTGYYFVKRSAPHLRATRIGSAPTSLDAPSKQDQSVIITWSGDLSGQLAPMEENIPFSVKDLPPQLFVGGAKNLHSYISIFKRYYGTQGLYFDMGGIFGVDAHNDVQVSHLFKELSPLAIAASERELLRFSLNFPDTTLPIIATNAIDLTKGTALSEPPFETWLIHKVGEFKIGVISLATFSEMDQRIAGELKGLYIEDPILALLRSRDQLQKEGATHIIALMRVPSLCKDNKKPGPRSFSDRDEWQMSCPENDPLINAIQRFPPEAVDLVLTSGDHSFSGYFDKLPVAQIKRGSHIGLVRLGLGDQSDTELWPAIKLCSQFFSGTEDCHLEIDNNSIKNTRLKMIEKAAKVQSPSRFLGETVSPLETN
jgi:hypothetical protein